MVKKQPDFVFNISPGLNVKSAYISKDPISIEESVFRPDQLNLIEKIINNEISNIENEYQQKLEAEKKTAWQNGNQAGIKQTHNQLSQQVQNLLNNLNQLINNLQIQSDKIIENHEQDILTLILKIARKVIETEISLNPDIILEVLKKSLNLLNEKEDIKINVNPNDWSNVRNNIDKLNLTFDLADNIEIVSNENISQGTCRVDFRAGSIDADLDTQFAEIQRKLLKNAETI